MIQKLIRNKLRLLLFLCMVLQVLIFNSSAIAVPLRIDPFFGDPSVRELLQQGQFGAVRDMALTRLGESPDDGDMLAILAYAQAGLGEWENARQSVLRAIQLVPANRRDNMRVLLAEILLGVRDVAEAERVLLDVVERDPDNIRALMGLGFLHSRTDDVPGATDYFRQVLNIDPQHDTAVRALLQVYVAQGDYAAVARVARQIPVESPIKSIGYYFEALALIRQQEPEYGPAADLLEKALVVSMPTPEVLSTLGYVLMKEKRVQEAVTPLNQAVSLAPDFFEGRRLLGIALLDLNQPRIAAQHLEKALAIKESTELHKLLARAYLRQGRGEKGLAELVKSLERTGEPIDTQSELQGLYQYTSGDFEQSEEALRQALEETPGAEHVRFLLIAALLKQERFEGAAREANQALSVHPDQSVLLLNLLGLAKLGSGDFEEAEAALRRALGRDSGSATTRINLSTLYFRQAQYAKAERELDAILVNDPDDLETKIRLARVFQAADNYAEAERVLRGVDGKVPSAGALIRELIFLKIRQRNYDEAFDYARAMVAAYPRSFEGYLFQAQALASLGRKSDAVGALDVGFNAAGETQGSLAVAASLARVNGWHRMAVNYLRRHNEQFGLDDLRLKKLYAVELIEVGNTNKAREILRGGLDSTDPDALFLLAKSYMADGDQVRAEEYIDRALAAGVSPEAIDKQRAELSVAMRTENLKNNLTAEPDNANRYRALANAHEFVGDFDAAIAVYEDGMGKTGSDPAFQTQIARLLLKQGDTQRAIDVASGVVNSQSPGDDIRLGAYAVLGMSWALQRDVAKAEQALVHATGEGSRQAPAFYELAKIKSAKGETTEAIQLLQSAIEISPGSVPYYLALAALHQRTGSIEKSVAVYEDGLSRIPGSVALLNNVALVYLSQGANEKALSRAGEAWALAPENANVLDTIGWVHAQAKDPEKAVRYLERAVDREPASPLYRYHLGVVYFEVGSMDLAKTELEEALDRQSSAPWAPDIRRVLRAIGES